MPATSTEKPSKPRSPDRDIAIRGRDLLALEMGGTTAQASLVRYGEFTIVPESEVACGAAAGHRSGPRRTVR